MARFNGMPGNANNMMKQLQKMQKQMEEQAKAFESKEFEATAGGGAVRVTVVGGREVSKITLDKEALRMAEAENQQMMGKLTGGLPF